MASSKTTARPYCIGLAELDGERRLAMLADPQNLPTRSSMMREVISDGLKARRLARARRFEAAGQ
jgi:hypothetical protein